MSLWRRALSRSSSEPVWCERCFEREWFLGWRGDFRERDKVLLFTFFWATAASKIYTSLFTGLYTGLYARLNCFLERIKTSRAHWFLFCVKGVWNGVASLAAKILTKLASKIGFFFSGLPRGASKGGLPEAAICICSTFFVWVLLLISLRSPEVAW